jgi:DNA-binding transcriptional ArsR family regulator
VWLTADSVKVLAHPLRSRLLGELRRHGPATATTLADRLHTNSGTASYHLRRLEAVGLVADTGEGRGKERLWAAATDSHGWHGSEFDADDDASAALGWLVRDYHRRFDQDYTAWLDHAESWPEAWRDQTGMSDAWIEVTPEDLARFNADVDALITRYHHAAGGPDARRVHVFRFVFPLDVDQVPDAGSRRPPLRPSGPAAR